MPSLAFYFLPISLFSIFWCTQITEGVKHLHRRSYRAHQMENSIDTILDTIEDPDTSDCHFERKDEQFTPDDLREAHAGLFRDIPWTKEERLVISDLHSTQQYHLLGPLLKKKLASIDASLQYKTDVTKFFVDHYPPKEVRQLHDNASKCRVSLFNVKFPNLKFVSLF